MCRDVIRVDQIFANRETYGAGQSGQFECLNPSGNGAPGFVGVFPAFVELLKNSIVKTRASIMGSSRSCDCA